MALLGKQLDVRPPGWQEVSRPFGDPGTTFSVADITDAGSLARVRALQISGEGGGQSGQGRRRSLGATFGRSGDGMNPGLRDARMVRRRLGWMTACQP